MDEVEAVAQAISEARTGNTLSYRHFVPEAQAAIAAIDAARGDPVARLIAYMKTIEPDEETAGCPATWADFIQILEGIAEAGSRSMVEVTDAELDRLVATLRQAGNWHCDKAAATITALRARIAEDQAQIAALTTYRENLRDEVIELRARIAELEAERAEWVEVERLRMGKPTPPTPPA